MESLVFDGAVLDETSLIHDSTNELFRSPVGAVACGTEVRLALKVGRPDIESATLCLLEGDDPVERIAMESITGTDLAITGTVPLIGTPAITGTVLLIGTTVKRSVPSVVWYWFEIRLSGGAVCYYGAGLPYASGLGRVYCNPPPPFQLTVYEKDFTTPDWARTAILYQIFPDRFCMGDESGVRSGVEYHRGMGRSEFELHENWEDLPVFEAKDGRDYYMPSDIFGGDLEGIRKRLSYLKELGVTLLYLNPVFEAASNHRYNTGDYLKIDPILGDGASFRRLAEDARASGVRLMLDGVFSHTGDDSLYFNKYGRYEGVGAYQSKDSPYYDWYKFDNHPDDYVSWWGFETLPEVNKSVPGWREFVISGRDSVVKHWLREGASGYRLDVADELPDDIIELIRAAVKETDPEAFLLGEVWEDAITKQSYGSRRTYALGLGLDAVMNYPFLNRTIEFLTGKIDASLYCMFLTHQRHTYPAPMYFTLMNLLSSHDVCRIRTKLAAGVDPANMSREEQARFELTLEEYELGGLRQRLASAIQFSLPGMPSIYYGDEAGMTGLLDPFNRRAFREEDASITEWYKTLAGLRRGHPVMSTGDVRFYSTDGSVLGILRYTTDGHDFFGGDMEDDAVLTVINPTGEPRRLVFELGDVPEQSRPLQPIKSTVPVIGVSLLTGLEISLDHGLAEIDMPPLGAEIFCLRCYTKEK